MNINENYVNAKKIAENNGIGADSFGDYLRKNFLSRIRITKVRFGSDIIMINVKDVPEMIEGYKAFKEQEEREHQERLAFLRLPPEERQKEAERRRIEAEQKAEAQREEEASLDYQKQEYLESLDEFFEYSLVTLINSHGRIDTEQYVQVLNEKAREGWRLRTVHTNELGKDAIRILGFGVNATVSEDVLIFERRIKRDMQRDADRKDASGMNSQATRML